MDVHVPEGRWWHLDGRAGDGELVLEEIGPELPAAHPDRVVVSGHREFPDLPGRKWVTVQVAKDADRRPSGTTNPGSRHVTKVRPELVEYEPEKGGLRIDLVGEGVAGTLASLSVSDAGLLAGDLMGEIRRAYRAGQPEQPKAADA